MFWLHKKDISKAKVIQGLSSIFMLFDQIVVEKFISDMVFGIAHHPEVQGQELWV